MASSFDLSRANFQRRIEAIEARLEAFNVRARSLLDETVRKEGDNEERIRHLDLLESKLEALEERLHKLEDEMRSKESPPESFGTERRFSTGLHFPGLG
jgi:chromosome segregation ATPase